MDVLRIGGMQWTSYELVEKAIGRHTICSHTVQYEHHAINPMNWASIQKEMKTANGTLKIHAEIIFVL